MLAKMNSEAIVEIIASMNNEQQEALYNSLLESGFTDEDILAIKKYVGIRKIMTDDSMYKAVRKSLCESVWNENH